ncbi:TlpA disulfide reductase family protein [Mucilaginibacter terrenus]|nr:TlpA disulfide reductase family protein [Mucilaginibacter terrenus]
MPVRKGPAPAAEIKAAKAVAEAYPDSIKAQKKFIYAMGLENPELIPQYKIWMKNHPNNVNIPLAIGTVFNNAEMAQAREFLLKAAELDPKNANVWYMLSADAERWGQSALAKNYIEKATIADPADVTYAYVNLMYLKDSNPDVYKQKVYDFTKQFPENERGAQALYWLAVDATNMDIKRKYLEDLRTLYPPQKFNWSYEGMTSLADIYLQTDPEKALSLASEMREEEDWKIRKQVALSLIQINKLEQEQNYKEALNQLKLLTLPRWNYIRNFIELKKSSLLAKSGDVKDAYDNLVLKFAKLPNDELYSAIKIYAHQMGKDELQIDKDVKVIREASAVQAFPFELGLYTVKNKLKLNDLKGKVVLLTFWFPGCGPCRAEFPHFQAVVNKFKNKNLVYLGINVTPEQDSYVLPFMKNSGFSFIPLRGNPEFAAKSYGVRGEPENFLIDKDGKIIFKNFSIDGSNQRTLELMISSLLQ